MSDKVVKRTLVPRHLSSDSGGSFLAGYIKDAGDMSGTVVHVRLLDVHMEFGDVFVGPYIDGNVYKVSLFMGPNFVGDLTLEDLGMHFRGGELRKYNSTTLPTYSITFQVDKPRLYDLFYVSIDVRTTDNL